MRRARIGTKRLRVTFAVAVVAAQSVPEAKALFTESVLA
jgi:hypothetical protein